MVIPMIPTNDVTSAFVFPRKGWIIPIALTTSRVSIFAREALNIIPMTKIINMREKNNMFVFFLLVVDNNGIRICNNAIIARLSTVP